MGILSKISHWRTKLFLWVGLPVLAGAGIMFGAFDLVPAWQAHNGAGTAGTFVAEREECGRRSCSLYGSWTATDGSKQLSDVKLNDGPDQVTVGQEIAAVDSGARMGVFAATGGSSYLFVTAFVVGGVAALVGWVFVVRNAIKGRRRDPAAVPA